MARGGQRAKPRSGAPPDPTCRGDVVSSVLDLLPAGVMLLDKGEHIVLVNRETERLLGIRRDRVVGDPISELFPEGLGRPLPERRSGAPAGAGRPSRRVTGRRGDGTTVPIDLSVGSAPLAGSPIIPLVLHDARLRVEDEARARDIRDILDATRDGVSIVDAKTLEFVYVNQGLVEQVGYTRAELRTMRVTDIAPALSEPELHRALTRFERGDERSQTVTTTYRRRDGSFLPVEIVSQAIQRGEGRLYAYVHVARDLTERLAIEALARRAQEEARVRDERERVARDLHDLVIQRLFATGMAAQALRSHIRDPDVDRRLGSMVDELDDTIEEIRTAIFGLVVHDRQRFRDRVLELAQGERVDFGPTPSVRFEGPVDILDDRTAFELLAILREMLSNVARHSGATRVDVRVVSGDEFRLAVTDNGIGIGVDPGGGRGLANMAHRARALGGTFSASAAAGGGTVVECRIPIPGASLGTLP